MPFRSPWADIDVPDLSLPEFVLERAHELGSKPALVDAATGRALSYAALAECVRRTAAGLAARGFGRGDVLAVFAPNRIDWPVAFLGAALAGGAVTGVNQAFTADEVATQLRDAGARHLVTTTALLDRAVPAAAAASVESVLVLDGGPRGTPFATLLEHDEAAPTVTPVPTDIAFLPYSSGTTGLPKCVELSHRALVANSCQLGVGFAFDESQVHLAVAPFHGAAGTGLVIDTALRHGVTVVLAPRFEVGEIVRLIRRHRVTDLFVVPPMALAFTRHPRVDRDALASLRVVRCGSAPLDAALAQECAQWLGHPVLQAYGMTECGPGIAAVPSAELNKPGSVGPLLPGTEGRIVDPITGADLGTGEPGELLVRGPQLMSGYRGDPAATAAALDADGWLHTGDLVVHDADGHVRIVDRIKELIKVGGMQVPPAQLEAVLLTHPGIVDAAVVRIADEDHGEAPKAFVVARGDLTAEEVMAHVAHGVAPQKRLREVAFVDAIPRNPTGKILRRLLADPATTP